MTTGTASRAVAGAGEAGASCAVAPDLDRRLDATLSAAIDRALAEAARLLCDGPALDALDADAALAADLDAAMADLAAVLGEHDDGPALGPDLADDPPRPRRRARRRRRGARP